MTPLKEMQDNFQSFLLTGQDTMSQAVVDTQPMTAQRRLGVYYDGYRLRLIEALQVDYPKIEVLLGCDEFQKACLEFIEGHPSHHFSLRPFGQGFAQFLKETRPYSHYSFLSEMADFEWSLRGSLDTRDDTVMTFEDLKRVPPDQWGYLVFDWHSSVHTRSYEWDTPLLWSDIQNEKPQREPVCLESPQSWIFWRKELKSMYESMNPLQCQLADWISQKLTFGEMAEQLCEDHDPNEVPQLLLSHLQYWIQQGLFRAQSRSVG